MTFHVNIHDIPRSIMCIICLRNVNVSLDLCSNYHSDFIYNSFMISYRNLSGVSLSNLPETLPVILQSMLRKIHPEFVCLFFFFKTILLFPQDIYLLFLQPILQEFFQRCPKIFSLVNLQRCIPVSFFLNSLRVFFFRIPCKNSSACMDSFKSSSSQ